MKLMDAVRASIDLDKMRLSHYERMAATSVEGRLNCKWDRRRSRSYYYLRSPGDERERMIRTEPNARVWRLQCKRFAEEMLRILRHNIAAKEQLAASLISDNTAFTILLPNGRVYYWEHKGMLSSFKYALRDAWKNVDYNINGIFQSHNLIVTEEGPNNNLDVEGIHAIVRTLL